MNKKNYDKEYRIKNKVKIAKRKRAYYEANREYILAYVLEYNTMYRAAEQGKIAQAKSSRLHSATFPEKARVRSKFTYFKTKNGVKTPNGYHFHHYSYNLDDYMGVVLLPSWLHRELHSRMVYIQPCKYYKTKDGVFLDTKFKHLSFINDVRKSLN